MSKSENAFRTITEAAAILDLPPHVLRFWESKFRQIKPMKRGGGRRYYRPEDLHLLLGIKFFLYTEGLTIKGTQKVIQSKGIKSVIKIGLENRESEPHNEKKPEKTQKKKMRKPLLWPLFLNTEQLEKIRNIKSDKLKTIISGFEQVHKNIKSRAE